MTTESELVDLVNVYCRAINKASREAAEGEELNLDATVPALKAVLAPLKDANEEIKRLRAALEKYGDEDCWVTGNNENYEDVWIGNSYATGAGLAQEALKGAK